MNLRSGGDQKQSKKSVKKLMTPSKQKIPNCCMCKCCVFSIEFVSTGSKKFALLSRPLILVLFSKFVVAGSTYEGVLTRVQTAMDKSSWFRWSPSMMMDDDTPHFMHTRTLLAYPMAHPDSPGKQQLQRKLSLQVLCK